MQLTGTLFSGHRSFICNDLSTFPDYPAEIRAPGTVGGYPAFRFILDIPKLIPGDYADVLIAMNPAAIKQMQGGSELAGQ
jgi:2-oxoglutarate ferredoxin oxidoreductase subunit alpha